MRQTIPHFTLPSSIPISSPIASRPLKLAALVRAALILTAAIDFVVGLAFLCGPEAGITLWPASIPSVLMRFIGAIVLANGVGAVVVAGRGSWDSARTLFIVALTYGGAVLLGLVYELLFRGAPRIFWGYVVIDFVFLVPILLIIGYYEWVARPAARLA